MREEQTKFRYCYHNIKSIGNACNQNLPKVLGRFINDKLNIMVLVFLFVCGTRAKMELSLEL